MKDIIRLVIIASVPIIALLCAFYFTDRFDREPVKLLFKVFVLGAVSTVPAIIIENIFSYFNIFAGIFNIAFTAFIVAGFTEEYLKRLIVLKTAYNHPAFDEKLDGIIYAVFASLGFAWVENILYVTTNFSVNPYIGLYRGILSVPAHTIFGVTMGYYLSLSKFCPDPITGRAYFKKSLINPLILHGVFNFILMSKMKILLILFIPFVIYLWIISLRKLNLYYKDSKNRS